MQILTDKEIDAALFCVEESLRQGATGARVILNKTLATSMTFLDGTLDRSHQSCERSIDLSLFVDGRYGRFSTNRLDGDSLRGLMEQAVKATGLLAPDKCRYLPGAERKCRNAVTGTEMGLCDETYCNISADRKVDTALACCETAAAPSGGASILSIENEYTDTLNEELLLDSSGARMADCYTSFSFNSEVTLKGGRGENASAYDWYRSPFFRTFNPGDIVGGCIGKACSNLGGEKIKSGRYDVVVDSRCASTLVYPVLDALNGLSIFYGRSFLCDSLDKVLFCNDFTLWDRPLAKGRFGARLYDSEGIATEDAPIISNGRVVRYFTNCFAAAKSGLKPTAAEVSRPVVTPFICDCDKKEISLKDILNAVGSGVYITGFNGGNCNPSTGDFSFGFNGFRIENGRIGRPVKEALITGNMLDLFSRICAAGSDARPFTGGEIPTMAFRQMNINAI